MPSIGIADKTTLDKVKALIGAIDPAVGGTDSLFNYLKALVNYVDALETNLGATDDAANAAGTAMARLKDILNNKLTSARALNLDLIGFIKEVVPSNNVKLQALTEEYSSETALAVRKVIAVNHFGIYRVSVDVKGIASNSGSSSVYRNGVAYYAFPTVAGSYTTHTADLYFAAGDTIEIWTKTTTGNNVYCKNFKVSFDYKASPEGGTVVSD